MALPKGSLLANFFLFFKGVFMGVANKVPGVSGGAVAYIFEFYNELIYSFQKFNSKAFHLLVKGKFKLLYDYLNLPFLIYILGGVVFSYFTFSKMLDYFLKTSELYVWSVFFGMIIGSGIYLIQKFTSWNSAAVLSAFCGAGIGLAISFIEPAIQNDNLWFVFLCGIIGVSGMTMPGLSGSYIVMLMGNYVLLMVDAVNVFYDGLRALVHFNFHFFTLSENTYYLKIMVVFTIGSLVGLVLFSKLLVYVIAKFSTQVNAMIIGFIIGSLGTVWPWKEKIYAFSNNHFLLDKLGNKIVVNFERYMPEIHDTTTVIAVVFMTIGCLLVLGLEKLAKKK